MIAGTGQFFGDAPKAGRNIAIDFRIGHQGRKESVATPTLRQLFLEQLQDVVRLAWRGLFFARPGPSVLSGLPFEGLTDLVSRRIANGFVQGFDVEYLKCQNGGGLGRFSIPGEFLDLDPVYGRDQPAVFERQCEGIVFEARFDGRGGSALDLDTAFTSAMRKLQPARSFVSPSLREKQRDARLIEGAFVVR